MDLNGRQVTVMGLGRFGGGAGAARYLVSRGASVTVTDLEPPEKLAESVKALEGLPITWRLGGHDEADFRRADLIVVNPAVPKSAPMLEIARQSGIPLSSELNLFIEACPAPIIAVTGTAGKSTTSSLLALALARRHRTHFGGNIGRSLLAELAEIGPDDRVLLEISSFQLEDAATLRWSPSIAVVTNLSENHLDHHGTMENYAAAKQNILRFQRPEDIAVLPAHDPLVSQWAPLTPGRVVWYDVRQADAGGGPRLDGGDCAWRQDRRLFIRWGGRIESIDLDQALRLPGEHNIANLMAAALAARAAGVSLAETAKATRDFRGLPHRLELVAEVGDVRFFNDSKATTPAAAEVALRSFRREQTIAIAGGYDKKIDLAPLVAALCRHARSVLLIGETAGQLAEMLAAAGHAHAEVLGTLERAVNRAAHLAAAGDVVLLSPGHASWDQFENFEQRGQQFAGLAASLPAIEPADCSCGET
jgi:UDP-N-acetylmuramoylalanine--D-glutamate ligase